MKCKQTINGRHCTRDAKIGNYCHQHHDQSLMARVARRCRMSTEQAQQVADTLIDEMGWEEINRFYDEKSFGQAEDDAGGFVLRCIGKLFGARGRYDDLTAYKVRARAAIKEPS